MADLGKAELQSSVGSERTPGNASLRTKEEFQSHFWAWDIGKTLFASFAGAGFAFVANSLFQRRIQIKENLAFGTHALFTIRSQWDDLLNYRYGIRCAMATAHLAFPDAPEWAYARPVAFNFREANVFDFKSLVFLLSTEIGKNAFGRLQYTERTYMDLMSRHNDFNATAQERQRQLAPLHMKEGDVPFARMEKHLGPELIARIRDHQRAIVLRIGRDEQRYRSAFDLLNSAMAEMFGERFTTLPLTIPDKFREANLPKFPPVFQEYLDKVPHEPD